MPQTDVAQVCSSAGKWCKPIPLWAASKRTDVSTSPPTVAESGNWERLVDRRPILRGRLAREFPGAAHFSGVRSTGSREV